MGFFCDNGIFGRNGIFCNGRRRKKRYLRVWVPWDGIFGIAQWDFFDMGFFDKSQTWDFLSKHGIFFRFEIWKWDFSPEHGIFLKSLDFEMEFFL